MCLCRCFKDSPTVDPSFQIGPTGDDVPPIHSFTYFAGCNIQTLIYISVFSSLTTFVILKACQGETDQKECLRE